MVVVSTITTRVGILSIGIAFGVLFSLFIFNLEYSKTLKNLFRKQLFSSEDVCKPPEEDSNPLLAKMRSERILCWVMTGPDNHQSRAAHVRDTWGRRCDKLIFMSSKNDSYLPAVGLPVAEGRDHLWGKTKEAFKYIYKHYKDYDWYLKSDDDTYVIIENLRLLLSKEDSSVPKWYGYLYRTFVRQGYMSGAAYVLSGEAMRRLVEEGLPNPNICRQDAGGFEDVEIGYCLEKLGAPSVDTRDLFGRDRFLPEKPEFHLEPRVLDPKHWFSIYPFYPSELGPGCCSKYAATFHYISGHQLHFYEYIFYKLKIYGIFRR